MNYCGDVITSCFEFKYGDQSRKCHLKAWELGPAEACGGTLYVLIHYRLRILSAPFLPGRLLPTPGLSFQAVMIESQKKSQILRSLLPFWST